MFFQEIRNNLCEILVSFVKFNISDLIAPHREYSAEKETNGTERKNQIPFIRNFNRSYIACCEFHQSLKHESSSNKQPNDGHISVTVLREEVDKGLADGENHDSKNQVVENEAESIEERDSIQTDRL